MGTVAGRAGGATPVGNGDCERQVGPADGLEQLGSAAQGGVYHGRGIPVGVRFGPNSHFPVGDKEAINDLNSKFQLTNAHGFGLFEVNNTNINEQTNKLNRQTHTKSTIL